MRCKPPVKPGAVLHCQSEKVLHIKVVTHFFASHHKSSLLWEGTWRGLRAAWTVGESLIVPWLVEFCVGLQPIVKLSKVWGSRGGCSKLFNSTSEINWLLSFKSMVITSPVCNSRSLSLEKSLKLVSSVFLILGFYSSGLGQASH